VFVRKVMGKMYSQKNNMSLGAYEIMRDEFGSTNMKVDI
jgi:hypothetical protein